MRWQATRRFLNNEDVFIEMALNNKDVFIDVFIEVAGYQKVLEQRGHLH